jgi:methylthioribose-1-phosphate isomerase
LKKTLKDSVKAFRWLAGERPKLLILDQLLIPREEKWIECTGHAQVADCIRDMNVRGAPAIGCVAAYGLALVAHERRFENLETFRPAFEEAAKTLGETRPTAVNLFWAIERMKSALASYPQNGKIGANAVLAVAERLEKEAVAIYEEDLAANQRMADLGAELIPNDSVILTHCNTGSLATSGWGTALGVIRRAYEQGKVKKVLVDETRPYLQGARLTAWELSQDGIPYELITDNMAAHLMKTEKISAAIVGSDRIASNGDVANKIGTYGVAVLCKYHNIPFYVAAPTSTVDLKIRSGEQIPIEERSHREVTHIKEVNIAPDGVIARHPAFDVTPHELVSAIITEKGVASPPSTESVKKLFGGTR